jgi:hypothetical protein
MYWGKRFFPGLLDLAHRFRRSERKTAKARATGGDADRRAA